MTRQLEVTVRMVFSVDDTTSIIDEGHTFINIISSKKNVVLMCEGSTIQSAELVEYETMLVEVFP